ncbi:hypothetical protein BDZ90DRAFT_230164 [Jaminaea rosea]|uniref:G-patch domain-containing protein n=1 Tax=Jaminaea rosea TaxID=1569628 RepID=A0A316UVD7_9BASI|nr:hypothetical protein BDZ90DRAFT_230164 [Jaminaea rosea]PWN29267.1 hypothetical protein BDZ90DRAFT_230164 [Jaminaea rosea]
MTSRHLARLARDDHHHHAAQPSSFVTIGTPLPPLVGRGRDPNEGKPAWEQEVRDEQGRRRFHGAFTGGWSAGYYNSVGSKEGWTPQTFTSSRRAGTGGERREARPEDFMDDEDLAELDETRVMGSRAGYAGAGQEKSRHAEGDVLSDLLGLGKGAIPGEVDAAGEGTGLIAPPSSLGHKILARMGWKAGEGLGALVKAERRALLEGMLGLALSQVNAAVGRGGLIPPPDTPLPALTLDLDKRDSCGLGWRGGSGASAATSSSTSAQRGFDISVLEEEDEDDLADIYSSSESLSDALQRRRGKQGKQGAPPTRGDASSSTSITDSNEQRWRDGKALPPGFVLEAVIDDNNDRATIQSASHARDWFPPPQVPDGWKPDPFKVWGSAKASVPPPAPFLDTAAAAATSSSRQPQRDAAGRAQILGEAPMPGPPPSLANYMSSSTATQAATSTIPLPRLDPATARVALRDHHARLFGNDSEKQKRYVCFLERIVESSESGSEEPARMPLPPGRTVEEALAELEKFARLATKPKPTTSALSATMASRFAPARTTQGAGDVPAPTPGLYQPTPRSREESEMERKRREEEERLRAERAREEERSDEQKAAKAGLFGSGRTRRVVPFFPPKLLCKRFGVADPHPERAGPSSGEGEVREHPHAEEGEGDPFDAGPKSGEKWERSAARREIARGEARWESSRRELLSRAGERRWEDKNEGQPLATAEKEQAEEPRVVRSLEQVGLGEGDEEQLIEIERGVRPGREVFRAVFESDGEEDGNSDGEENGQEMGMERKEVDRLDRAGGEWSSKTATATATTTLPVLDEAQRPLFVPRAKTQSEADAGGAAANKRSRPRAEEGKKQKSKKAKASRGALTFDLDGEGEEEGPVAQKKAKPAEKGEKREKAAAGVRVKASDLF